MDWEGIPMNYGKTEKARKADQFDFAFWTCKRPDYKKLRLRKSRKAN